MIDRNFTQRTRLRMVGAVILFVGLVVGLTACVAFWQAPVADLRITSPSPMGMFEAPLTVIFDISESHGIGQEIATFKLEFGDGAYKEGTDITLPIEHVYAEAGVFFAVLTITDTAGATGQMKIRIDTRPVHVYFSTVMKISRVPAAGGAVEMVGGVPSPLPPLPPIINLFPSLVLNTRDKIAFTVGADTPPYLFDIWRMGIEGQLLTQLTDSADDEVQPTWSRGGDTIAYARHKDGLLWQIWTMTADGAGQAVLINQTPSHVWAPAFSPVNDDLVFVQQETGAVSELWIRRGAAEPVVLYRVPAVRVGDPSPPPFVIPVIGAGISQPRWSPCGTKIVFARERTATPPIIIDIYILTLATGASVTLEEYVIDVADITTDKPEFSPHWLEDGNIVFIRKMAIDDFRLFHVDLTTGLLTELTGPGIAISPAQR